MYHIPKFDVDPMIWLIHSVPLHIEICSFDFGSIFRLSMHRNKNVDIELKYFYFQTEKVIYIATEPVTPLETYLRESSSEGGSSMDVANFSSMQKEIN
jgi:hypothetical protein